MGYNVTILRSGQQDTDIRADEVESIVGGKFGFTLVRDETGTISHAYKEIDGNDFVLAFTPPDELWAKNPRETELQVMLDVAKALGKGARVRGDEYETYKTVNDTYTHPDDLALIPKPSVDWRGVLSWAPTIIGFGSFAVALIYYLIKRVL